MIIRIICLNFVYNLDNIIKKNSNNEFKPRISIYTGYPPNLII